MKTRNDTYVDVCPEVPSSDRTYSQNTQWEWGLNFDGAGHEFGSDLLGKGDRSTSDVGHKVKPWTEKEPARGRPLFVLHWYGWCLLLCVRTDLAMSCPTKVYESRRNLQKCHHETLFTQTWSVSTRDEKLDLNNRIITMKIFGHFVREFIRKKMIYYKTYRTKLKKAFVIDSSLIFISLEFSYILNTRLYNIFIQ